MPQNRTRSRRRLIGVLAAIVALAAAGITTWAVNASPPPALAVPTTSAAPIEWTTAWMTAPQRPGPGIANWSDGFADQTLRQVVRSTWAGEQVRVTLSNRYGTEPLRVAAATVAISAGGANVVADTMRPLLFAKTGSVEIPVGGEVVTDAADLPVDAFTSITITIYLAEPTSPVTFHARGGVKTYRVDGDHADDIDGHAFDTKTSQSWYLLSQLEVNGGPTSTGTVVAFGDSLTDGLGADIGTDTRYPDRLAELLTAAGNPHPVLNAGISGNLTLQDSDAFGDAAVNRFTRDALKPGVTTVIILTGLNDFGYSEVDAKRAPNPDVSVDELIEGHRELIAAAHDAGVLAIGATLLPMKGSYNATTAHKVAEFNDWIRDGGEYDAVVDFNAALADPSDTEALDPAFDSGDHKHPNTDGYAAMAAAIDATGF